MELTPDYKEFIGLLKKHNVNSLIVGDYAVNLYGYPRYTDDLDIWVRIDKSNIQKLLVVLNEFGFSSLKLNAEDFRSPENVIRLGYAPNRIDLLVELRQKQNDRPQIRTNPMDLILHSIQLFMNALSP